MIKFEKTPQDVKKILNILNQNIENMTNHEHALNMKALNYLRDLRKIKADLEHDLAEYEKRRLKR